MNNTAIAARAIDVVPAAAALDIAVIWELDEPSRFDASVALLIAVCASF